MARDIDTTNQFSVSFAGSQIVVLGLATLRHPISKAQAVNLAAWLVALADPGRETFDRVLKEIMES